MAAPMSSIKVVRLIVCLIAAVALVAQPKPSGSDGPLWTEEIGQELSNYAGISFLNNDKLLAYEVERTGQLSSRESPEISSAFRLHVSLLDARSGKLILSRDWGTRLHSTEVQVTTGGVLLKTGAIIKLYSPDFAKARDLPLALDPNGSYFTSVSVSGQTIAVSHYFQKGHKYISHLDVLDANTLKIRRFWDQYPPIFRLSMSDERFVTVDTGVVAVNEFGSTDWSKVLDVPMQRCPAGGSPPTMVSDQLVVLRGCQGVLLLSVAGMSSPLDAFNGRGTTAARGAPCLPYKVSAKVAVASGGAQFVALTLPALKIKKPLLAESRTCLDGLDVAVYDLTLKRRVFTVSINPLPKNNYDFALSPDGSKLAVLNDRKVSVYLVTAQHAEAVDVKDGGVSPFPLP